MRGLLALLWALLLPSSMVATVLLRSRWLLEDTLRHYLFLAVAALVVGGIWSGGMLLLIPPLALEPGVKGMLGLGALVGLCGGNVALNIANIAFDASEGTLVSVRLQDFVGVNANFEVADGPQAGLTFNCGRSTWGEVTTRERLFLLYPGRIGLWWGQLQ